MFLKHVVECLHVVNVEYWMATIVIFHHQILCLGYLKQWLAVENRTQFDATEAIS